MKKTPLFFDKAKSTLLSFKYWKAPSFLFKGKIESLDFLVNVMAQGLTGFNFYA